MPYLTFALTCSCLQSPYADEDPWILPPEILILQYFLHSITTLISQEQQIFPRKAVRGLKIDSAKKMD